VLARQAEQTWGECRQTETQWTHRPEVETLSTPFSVAGNAEGQLNLYNQNVSLNRGS
jgi:hypothetical protein